MKNSKPNIEGNGVKRLMQLPKILALIKTAYRIECVIQYYYVCDQTILKIFYNDIFFVASTSRSISQCHSLIDVGH